MLKVRLINLGDAIWARALWAAKAIMAAAVPILTDYVLEVLELVEGEVTFWLAGLAGAVTVFAVPNDRFAPEAAKLRSQRRLLSR